MAIKDSLKNLFNYFEIDPAAEYDDREQAYQLENNEPKMRVADRSTQAVVEEQSALEMKRTSYLSPAGTSKTNMERLSERQQQLSANNDMPKTTIDIKFPKKYEEAPEIVNLLLENATILIDFQFMSETQARRCLDYLDGARSVLSGNLKKVSSTMWLLTPVNVTVNIEELRSANAQAERQYDGDNYDLKRY